MEYFFFRRHILTQHLHTHRSLIGGKHYRCSFENCSFTGRTVAEVRQHLPKHSDEKLFSCQLPECSYSGKTVVHLRRHMASHNPPKKMFCCTQCDFKTRQSSHLTRHLVVHEVKELLRCPHCSYECNFMDNLRKHVMKTSKHQGRFLYECTDCNVGTNVTSEYQEHLQSAHSQTDVDLSGFFSARK